MNQLIALFVVDEIGLSFLPRVLKVDERCDELRIIFQLRIDAFYVLFVFAEKVAYARKRFPDLFCKLPNGSALGSGNPST